MCFTQSEDMFNEEPDQHNQVLFQQLNTKRLSINRTKRLDPLLYNVDDLGIDNYMKALAFVNNRLEIFNVCVFCINTLTTIIQYYK